MRKWMRDKLKRRNKKSPEEPSSGQAPLQPAYFEAEPGPATPESEPEGSSEDVDEGETARVEPVQPAEDQTAASTEDAAGAAPTADARRPRRRRRGGRGRRRPAQPSAEPSAAQPPAPAEASPSSIDEHQPPSGTRDSQARAGAAPVAEVGRPATGIVVLAVGLPGSGKSSWFKRHHITPLSSDVLRSMLFDDPTEQRFQDLVFSNLRSMLKARLIARRPMNYVDATNLTPHERHNWIKLARDFGYEAHAVFFDVPLEVCIERHQRRDRTVPDDVMRKMSAKLKPPTFEEGFSKITVVRVKQKEP